ncbi:MAG: hypothetical protein AAGE94_03470 [Acidobacteriota bacterium]
MTNRSSSPPAAALRPMLGRVVDAAFSRATATVVGSTLVAIGGGLATTIFVPGHDGLDEAFLGGLVVAAIWPVAILWILFAPTAPRAWRRGMLSALVLLGASAARLVL